VKAQSDTLSNHGTRHVVVVEEGTTVGMRDPIYDAQAWQQAMTVLEEHFH
jgi:hypothetical protein